MTDETDVLITEGKGNVCTFIISRPEKRNSPTPETLLLLDDGLEDFARGNHVRTVIIHGIGEVAFSSGYNIAAIPTRADPGLRERMRVKYTLPSPKVLWCRWLSGKI